MATYVYACDSCGASFEHQSLMRDHTPHRPCRCGKVARQVITPPAVYGDLDDFSGESGGRGRWNDQLSCYVKSKQDTIDKAKARGWRPIG